MQMGQPKVIVIDQGAVRRSPTFASILGGLPVEQAAVDQNDDLTAGSFVPEGPHSARVVLPTAA